MTPDAHAQAQRKAARRADWVWCEQLGRILGRCLLVTWLRAGLRRLGAPLPRQRAPRRAG